VKHLDRQRVSERANRLHDFAGVAGKPATITAAGLVGQTFTRQFAETR